MKKIIIVVVILVVVIAIAAGAYFYTKKKKEADEADKLKAGGLATDPKSSPTVTDFWKTNIVKTVEANSGKLLKNMGIKLPGA